MFTIVVISSGILGATILPIVPAVMVNCAECTFPLAEDVSLGNIIEFPYLTV